MSSVSVPIYHECVCDECERLFRCSGEGHAQTEEHVCDECALAAQRIARKGGAA